MLLAGWKEIYNLNVTEFGYFLKVYIYIYIEKER